MKAKKRYVLYDQSDKLVPFTVQISDFKKIFFMIVLSLEK